MHVLKMQDNWRWVAYEEEVRSARKGYSGAYSNEGL